MNINKVQDRFKDFSRQAKNTFDCAKMEIKIKNYERECKKYYTKIGMLVYESSKTEISVNSEEIKNICTEINDLKHKIKVIKKQIDNTKSDIIFNSANDDSKASKKNIDKNIKFLKFCPKCNVGNEPDSIICTKCGYKFQKK